MVLIGVLDFLFGKAAALLLPRAVLFIDVVSEIVKNEMEFSRHKQHLFKLDDIRMAKFSQRFDLPKLQTFLPVLVLLLHLLYGDDFAGFGVYCFEDRAECAVTQHFYYLVFLHLTIVMREMQFGFHGDWKIYAGLGAKIGEIGNYWH